MPNMLLTALIALLLGGCGIDQRRFEVETRALTCSRASNCGGLDHDTCVQVPPAHHDACWVYDAAKARACVKQMSQAYGGTCSSPVRAAMRGCSDVWSRSTAPECRQQQDDRDPFDALADAD